MSETKDKLIEETDKWLEKLKVEIPGIDPENKKEEEALENINAYIEDSDYFRQKEDHVRAFEACIWAWAVYEMIFKFIKE